MWMATQVFPYPKIHLRLYTNPLDELNYFFMKLFFSRVFRVILFPFSFILPIFLSLFLIFIVLFFDEIIYRFSEQFFRSFFGSFSFFSLRSLLSGYLSAFLHGIREAILMSSSHIYFYIYNEPYYKWGAWALEHTAQHELNLAGWGLGQNMEMMATIPKIRQQSTIHLSDWARLKWVRCINHRLSIFALLFRVSMHNIERRRPREASRVNEW